MVIFLPGASVPLLVEGFCNYFLANLVVSDSYDCYRMMLRQMKFVVEFAPSVNHHVERDLLDSVVTRTY